MATPRPTPTALKLLRGNPGQRKINKREPSLAAEIPAMPQTLRDAEAKREWKRITELLNGVGVLTRIDVKALALYCDTWSLYREAMKRIGKEGVVVYTHNNSPVQNPYVAVLHKTRTDMMKLLMEFGMTPAARTKVSVVQGPQDDLDDFLTSKNAS